MKKVFLAIIVLTGFIIKADAQKLKPGFDVDEYIELLKVIKAQFDAGIKNSDFPKSQHCKLFYSSKEGKLKNQWNLWLRDDGVAVISIRGTVPAMSSWLENFYVPMVPAQGIIAFSDSVKLPYKLAEDSNAAVHAGWLVGMMSIAKDVETHLKKLRDSLGTKEIIVTGHSQGGAISYLMTAYLHYRMKEGNLYHFKMKTYCSAAPKPGNLFFAYDYETYTDGWAFNVVNVVDWVPQTPFGVETIDDLNPVNPFVTSDDVISKLKFPKNVVVRKMFKKLKKGPQKVRDNYIYYLGKKLYPHIESYMRGLKEPEYFNSMDYQRTGRFIVLKPDKEYFAKYPYRVKDIKNNIFLHHFIRPYLMLAEKYKAHKLKLIKSR